MTSSPTLLTRRCAALLLGAVFGLCAFSASGHAYVAGQLKIVHPYGSPTRPGASTGALYIRQIENLAALDEWLLSVSTPAAAQVQIHRMEISSDGVMKMREIKSLLLKSASATDLGTKSGFHLMLVGLSQSLKLGDKVPVTLLFKRAGAVNVEFVIEGNETGSENQKQNHTTH